MCIVHNACEGLDENVLQRLLYLNTWSPFGVIVLRLKSYGLVGGNTLLRGGSRS